ncbi:class I SAM-dependent methyltransferase [Pleurocapsales cyanobacterium LEGE 06147]|nr:class I SAM-dependent methyltransferase [Pleurocapsales cyanobacterium LEGE 06147]
MSTDTEWEKWGKRDPYFAVITHEKFRNRNLTKKIKAEFFESGKSHINHVLKVCRNHLDRDFSPKRVLDFGCGTGRLVIPLAEIAEHVVGIDVSGSMLKEAQKNCEEYSVINVNLFKSDDNLSFLDGCFDFIHSVIVFQHVPVERGRRIFMNLLNHLERGGICALQFTYSKSAFKKSYGVVPLKARLKAWEPTQRLKRLVKKLFPRRDPEMQMNPYNVNELLFLMQTAGIRNFYAEFTDHGGELGVFLYFQKPK